MKLFLQGYSTLAVHPELLRDEPSVLLMDIGGWTMVSPMPQPAGVWNWT